MRIEIPSALNTAFLAGAMLFLPGPADAALPEGWTLNEYRTYLPLCRAETLTNAEGSVSIRLTDARGVSGARAVREEMCKVESGDVAALVFEARGKGGLYAGFFTFDERGVWNPSQKTMHFATTALDKEWRRYRIHRPVVDGKKPVARLKPVIGCAKGAEIEFRNVSAFKVAQASAINGAGKDLLPPPADRFDAAAEGWPLVFEDEFDAPAGTLLDTNKWEIATWRGNAHMARHNGRGQLELACDFKPGTNTLVSTSAWTRKGWTYGCFEARLKFTRNNGWWSSFWMYGWSNNNPFEDGAEIDIYEDASTRMKPASPVRLFSTLHMYHQPYDGGILKSFSHDSSTPESEDGFHTVACRWTPLEISIYLDGKRTGTFDAFEHGAVSAPLHALLSGCIMRSWGHRDTKGFKFPECLVVDYVRVYACPDASAPKVEWAVRNPRLVRRGGEKLTFEANVRGKNPIRAAYLFDSGYPVAAAYRPPWRFEIPFDEDYYGTTGYMASGSQCVSPDINGLMHSFRVFAVDGSGNVGVTPDSERVLPRSYVDAYPRVGGVQHIPGKVALSDGSDGCRPRMRTGTGVTCEVEVAEDGEYEAVLRYASIHDDLHHVLILVDGVQVADVRCTPSPNDRYDKRESKPVRMKLSAGRHEVTFTAIGFIHAGPMTFVRADGKR